MKAKNLPILFLISFCLFYSPALAQTLRVGCGADRYSKAEHYLTFCKWNPNAWVTEPLVNSGEDYRPKPGLIERWERSGNTYRLFIRKGIKFHNGATLDAHAVRSALIINAKNRSETLRIIPDSYKIIDRWTLEFQTRHKTVHFIGFLAHPFVACYAPDTDPVNAPVGTGPFIFEDYKRDRYLKVIRNDDYWGEKAPNERVIYKFIPDPQARLLALMNGEVDIIHPVETQILMSLPPSQDYRIVASKLNTYNVLTVNIHGEKPFDILRDVNVRKALAYAIDRPLLAETMYSGKARSAKTILAPWFWKQGEDFIKGYNFNLQKAKQLLESAEWKEGPDGIRVKNGRLLKLRLVSGWPTASALSPLPELLQQMFREVGVHLELVQTDDDGVYYDRYMAPGKGDLFLERAANTGNTPAFLLYMLYHSVSPWLKSGYKWALPGKAFDEFVNRAQVSTDPEEVVRNIQGAQRVLIDDVCAVIPIMFSPDIYLVQKNIQFDPDRGGGHAMFGYAVKN